MPQPSVAVQMKRTEFARRNGFCLPIRCLASVQLLLLPDVPLSTFLAVLLQPCSNTR